MKPLQPVVNPASFGPVIVIERGSNRLGLFDGTSPVRSFSVATGRAQYPTPTGLWHIVDMQRNPSLRPPDSDWWLRHAFFPTVATASGRMIGAQRARVEPGD